MTDTLTLKVLLQPGASKNEIIGMHGDYLKIRVSAPPEKGAANAALIKLLASHYKIPQTSIKVITGKQSRYKTVILFGICPTDLPENKG